MLETFALADPELHWDKFYAGIPWAAVRWLLDHHDDSWRPHNLPESIKRYRAGALDGCLPTPITRRPVGMTGWQFRPLWSRSISLRSPSETDAGVNRYYQVLLVVL